MKNPLLRLLTLLTLSGIVLSLTVWAIASSSQQASPATQADSTKQKPEAVAVDHIPIVDYENSASMSPTDIDPRARALRSAKGERYAKHIRGLIVDRDTDQGMILASRYIAPLPALPVGSDVVALGEVVDAKAYLSDDKTGVYSEFSVLIEDVFKKESMTPIFPGSLVVTERYGGRVRFPSGRVTFFGNRDQGMPRQGGRYVFFLKRDDQQYSILTAYELLSGRVYPIDGKNAPGRDTSWAGNAYEKADAAGFLSEIRTFAMTNSREITGKVVPRNH